MTTTLEYRERTFDVRYSRGNKDVDGLFFRVKGIALDEKISYPGMCVDGLVEGIIGVYMAENSLNDINDLKRHMGIFARVVHSEIPWNDDDGNWFEAQDRLSRIMVDFWRKWVADNLEATLSVIKNIGISLWL